jgi:lipid-binding SYLF domain-containing protein
MTKPSAIHHQGLYRRRSLLLVATGAFVSQLAAPLAAEAASARQLTDDGRAALVALYAGEPKAAELGKRAKAVLVFPNIVKAGFIVGGENGDGVLFIGEDASSFYRISAASFGYQLGAERFGYALFFITDSSIDHLKKNNGWAVGTGPTLVVMDKGIAKTLNTMTLDKDVYALSFGQHGLMAGAGLQGSKITQISPDPE